jgi:hypothetical protein
LGPPRVEASSPKSNHRLLPPRLEARQHLRRSRLGPLHSRAKAIEPIVRTLALFRDCRPLRRARHLEGQTEAFFSLTTFLAFRKGRACSHSRFPRARWRSRSSMIMADRSAACRSYCATSLSRFSVINSGDNTHSAYWAHFIRWFILL